MKIFNRFTTVILGVFLFTSNSRAAECVSLQKVREAAHKIIQHSFGSVSISKEGFWYQDGAANLDVQGEVQDVSALYYVFQLSKQLPIDDYEYAVRFDLNGNAGVETVKINKKELVVERYSFNETGVVFNRTGLTEARVKKEVAGWKKKLPMVEFDLIGPLGPLIATSNDSLSLSKLFSLLKTSTIVKHVNPAAHRYVLPRMFGRAIELNPENDFIDLETLATVTKMLRNSGRIFESPRRLSPAITWPETRCKNLLGSGPVTSKI